MQAHSVDKQSDIEQTDGVCGGEEGTESGGGGLETSALWWQR